MVDLKMLYMDGLPVTGPPTKHKYQEYVHQDTKFDLTYVMDLIN